MTIMKKTLSLFLIIFLSSSFAWSQYVETYPNSQRYYFNELVYGEQSFLSCAGGVGAQIMYTRYATDTQLTVYGVAIPIESFIPNEHRSCDSISTIPTIDPLILYDSVPHNVYFALEPINDSLPITIYDSTSILENNHFITGNYVQFPEPPRTDDRCPIYQTIEVYYTQPITIARSFGLGANFPKVSTSQYILAGITILRYPEEGSANSYFSTVSGNIIHGNGPYFGGPGIMPIIAPPPCVPPFKIDRVGQQGRSVSFEWRAQYINSWCEAEYGPRDFAEGTGSVVGPITPNAEYKCSLTIDSLENLTEYTLRVRSWCDQTNSFSDWRSLDFTTEEWYTVTARSNNEYWGVVYGGDIYPAGTVVQLTAWPRGPEYLFTNWTDGSQQNPRTVTVTQDTLFKAIFIDQSAEGIDLAEGGATLTLSPNPAHSATTITAPFRILGWQITDSYGRTVAEQSGLNDYTASADLRRLSPGLYIIRVNSGNGILTKKLIRL